MERPRDPFELIVGLREDIAGLGAGVTHLSADMSDVKHDLRRLDDRMFQFMLVQVGTLATALAALVAALLS